MLDIFINAPEKSNSVKTLFLQVLDRKGINGIASSLGLNKNTVKRWLVNDNVPKEYYADFARELGIEIIGEQGLDQFYTKPKVASWCWKRFNLTANQLGVNLSKYNFIEPSAGCGWFYNQMPPKRRIGIDISPNAIDIQGKELIQADFLKWEPDNKKGKYVVVGNPPFGLRGHLALQFINHASKFSDMVGFILPQLFESDGKGVPAKRVKDLQLAYSKPLPADSFELPNGKPITIYTTFQVWTKINTNKIVLKKKKICNQFIKVFSLSDGGTPSSTRNKKMLYDCDVYLPSTCFNGMRVYKNFEELPHRRGYGIVIKKEKRKIKSLLNDVNWGKVAYPSTNSALNLRRSIIEAQVVKGGYVDGN